ncbi:acyl-CoA reductase [Polyangium mundeleinium]|uniref:Acyl-CoA reductase n=1 Tax=Polyangium mundeleinium TaxID=2995306 RepID=A0ABT5F5P2_9BACT|nr:acyl-CoA reductase [Polyangium mundeleinium]MDC0749417.1 acyl-CoA reductase [Polyangium mundeleinium]
MSAEAEARARVLRVVAAGRRIQDPNDPLGAEARARLPEVTGLDPKGVELALSAHLETQPTDAEIDTLLARTGRAPRCHLVLAANVCTAPLRALALAAATSPDIVVRPSRRDPVVTDLLVRALAADETFVQTHHASLTRASTISPAPGDELHVYGSDASIEAVTRSLPAGVCVRGHGTGIGLAVVGADAALDDAAEALARDVVPFDQRGCLSPRFVLVEGGEPHAEQFVQALDAALARTAARIPRGPLDPALAAEITLYGASMEAVGLFLARPSHAVGFDPSPRALVLPPAARVVHVVALALEQAPQLLAPWAPFVTAVGSSDDGALARAVLERAPFARCSPLGAMQRPPLDGPVDLRPSRA